MLKKAFVGLILCLLATSACSRTLIEIETPTAAATPQAAVTSPPSPSPRPPTATRTAKPSLTPLPPTATPAAPSPSPVPATPTTAATPTLTANPLPHLAAGQPVTLTAIHMLDAEAGWAIGGAANVGDHVLRTHDGGNSWRDVTPPEPAPEDPSLPARSAIGFFMDANMAWITYGTNAAPPPAASTIWRTHDGGQTWEPGRVGEVGGFGDYYQPSDMQFVDGDNGWLLVHLGVGMSHDYVALFRTTDGGATWEVAVDPNQNNLQMSCEKTGMTFVDAKTGWVTGDCHGVAPGLFFQRTDDGGRTWQPQDLAPPADAPDLFHRDDVGCGTYSPALLSPRSAVVVASCLHFTTNPPTADNFLYLTADGGQTWQLRSSRVPSQALTFISVSVGWAMSATNFDNPTAPRDLYQTRDGGQTWAKIKTLNWDGQLDFASDQVGWAVARSGEEVALVQTGDGGRTWKQVKPLIAP